MSDVQGENDKILHQDAVEDVIDDELAAEVQLERTTVADAVAATPVGASFNQAEINAVVTVVNSLVTKVNQILASLEAADIHASS